MQITREFHSSKYNKTYVLKKNQDEVSLYLAENSKSRPLKLKVYDRTGDGNIIHRLNGSRGDFDRILRGSDDYENVSYYSKITRTKDKRNIFISTFHSLLQLEEKIYKDANNNTTSEITKVENLKLNVCNNKSTPQALASRYLRKAINFLTK